MDEIKISEIVQAVGGKTVNCSGDFSVKGIAASITGLKEGYLYFCLKDNTKNLDVLAADAVRHGASAAVFAKEVPGSFPQILVENPEEAYRLIAKFYRGKFNLPVIAVTGSYGKTSTKDMIACVLEEKYNTHKTLRNFNGKIGVPSSVLRLDSSHDVSVIEMGMETYGHIQKAADIARPSIAVITNIGTAHIGNFGKKEFILKAKMEVTTYFDSSSVLILNGDDEYLSTITDKPYKIIKVSRYGKGDYNAEEIVNLGENGVEFKCRLNGEEQVFRLKVPGAHNVYNALFAIAVGDYFHLDAEEIKSGLLKFKSEDLRMNVIPLKDGMKMILDCYTAEPDTVKAAIDVLDSFQASRKIAVLGGMFGQGLRTKETHRDIGNYLIHKCDLLLTVGGNAKNIYDTAKDFLECRHFESKEALCEYLKQNLKSGDVILVNGGRMAEMEIVGNYLSSL